MKPLHKFLTVTAAALALAACSSDDIPAPVLPSAGEEAADNATYTLVFDAERPSFQDDAAPSSRVTAGEWENGDIVLIRFNNQGNTYDDDGASYGYAVYNADNKGWTLNMLSGSLIHSTERASCVVIYIQGHSWYSFSSSTIKSISISPMECVYASENAIFYFNDSNELCLSASLKALMGRVRFTSDEPASIRVKGINRWEAIQNCKSFTCPITNYDIMPYDVSIDQETADGRYTSPYIYGFADPDWNYIKIMDRNNPDVVMVRQQPADYLSAGVSGVINVSAFSSVWEANTNRVWTLDDGTLTFTGGASSKVYSFGTGGGGFWGYAVGADIDRSQTVSSAWLYIMTGKSTDSAITTVNANTFPTLLKLTSSWSYSFFCQDLGWTEYDPEQTYYLAFYLDESTTMTLYNAGIFEFGYSYRPSASTAPSRSTETLIPNTLPSPETIRNIHSRKQVFSLPL